jgi:hypothetical protein
MYKLSKQSRNKFFSLLLLTLFCYNAIFCHLTLWAWKIYVQEELELYAQSLSNDKLFHFSLPKKNGLEKEIEFNGAMYDVIRFTEDETLIHYWCIRDVAETLITTDESPNDIFAEKHNQWAQHAKSLSKKQNQVIELSEYLFNEPVSPISSLTHPYLQLPLSDYSSITSPPPKLVAMFL